MRLDKTGKNLTIYLEEKAIPPKELEGRSPEPRGFMAAREIDDFMIRRMFVKLNIRRRRWAVDGTDKKLSRNWKLVAEGTRMSQDYATFLKGVARL